MTDLIETSDIFITSCRVGIRRDCPKFPPRNAFMQLSIIVGRLMVRGRLLRAVADTGGFSCGSAHPLYIWLRIDSKNYLIFRPHYKSVNESKSQHFLVDSNDFIETIEIPNGIRIRYNFRTHSFT